MTTRNYNLSPLLVMLAIAVLAGCPQLERQPAFPLQNAMESHEQRAAKLSPIPAAVRDALAEERAALAAYYSAIERRDNAAFEAAKDRMAKAVAACEKALGEAGV